MQTGGGEKKRNPDARRNCLKTRPDKWEKVLSFALGKEGDEGDRKTNSRHSTAEAIGTEVKPSPLLVETGRGKAERAWRKESHDGPNIDPSGVGCRERTLYSKTPHHNNGR